MAVKAPKDNSGDKPRQRSGTAPKGNRFWMERATDGKPVKFASPKVFWDLCCKYFEWCEDNPFKEGVVSMGKIIKVDKMRPFTIYGLCTFLGCSGTYILQLKRSQTVMASPEWQSTIEMVEDIIYNQKFSGAASGFFNPMIISRDLKLTDKQEVEQTSVNYNATVTVDEAREISKALENDY